MISFGLGIPRSLSSECGPSGGWWGPTRSSGAPEPLGVFLGHFADIKNTVSFGGMMVAVRQRNDELARGSG